MRGANQTTAWQFIVCLLSYILLITVCHGAGDPEPRRTDTNSTGLWVGEVHLDQVSVLNADNPDKDLEPTADRASMRLILHVNGANKTHLLSHVVLARTTGAGSDPNSEVLLTDEQRIHRLFEDMEKSGKELVARRIETASYDLPRKRPPPDPLPASFDPSRLEQDYESEHLLEGKVAPGETVRTRKGVFVLDRWHRSNPFRHAYHDQHREGYRIVREMEFVFDPAPPDADRSLGNYGVDSLTGIYQESIKGLVKPGEKITMRGRFILQRISLVDELNP